MTAVNQPGYASLAFSSGTQMQPVCSGMANLQQKTPISPLSNFRMASVSKQFTAMSILQLSVRKQLRLEDKLSHFFTNCTGSYRDITLRQLLTHTSGIQDYESLIPAGRKKQVLDEDTWELVNAGGELYFKPGARFRYSNTGYCILALVAAAASGTPFPALLKQLIFDPLAMSNSLVYEPGCQIPHRALGYIPSEAEQAQGKPENFVLNDQSVTSATKGDGGVYTSLTDYLKWHHALFTEKLAPGPVLNTAFRSQVPVAGGAGYGYGWFSARETDGSHCMFHSGETSGFLNIVYRNPSKKLLIAIFSNRNDGSISKKFEETARRLNVAVMNTPLFEWLSRQYAG